MIRILDPGSKIKHETRILLLRHAETSAPDLFHGAESDIGLGERPAPGRGRRRAPGRPPARRPLLARPCAAPSRRPTPIGRACGLVPSSSNRSTNGGSDRSAASRREEGLDRLRRDQDALDGRRPRPHPRRGRVLRRHPPPRRPGVPDRWPIGTRRDDRRRGPRHRDPGLADDPRSRATARRTSTRSRSKRGRQ